jgi:5'-3' exonuclease
MLAIYHCQRFRDFYIFREAPEFASVMASLSGGGPEMFYMNVPHLAASIYSEVMPEKASTDDDDAASGSGMWRRVYDYVFLCFFLGNDFLPHFPALNLRTHGIQVLTETYRTVIANKRSQYLVDVTTGKIQWKHLHTLIQKLASMEHELWLKEYAHRDKLAQRYTPPPRKEGSAGGSTTVIEELPIRMRGKELYIAPWEVGWEARYYRSLVFVGAPSAEVHVQPVCVNYLEALEWVFTYYVCGCPDWRWQYHYMYPPLLCDLIAHVPMFDTTFLAKDAAAAVTSPCTPLEQLRYVLPPSLHRTLIPGSTTADSADSSDSLSFRFEWAFCTYFWESHLVHA